MAREPKVTLRQIDRITMLAGMAKACVPELCEQASDGWTCIPHGLTRAQADRVIEVLKKKARRTADHEHAR